MKSIKSSLIIIASAGLLLLGACSNNNQAAVTSPNTQPSASPIPKTEGQHGKSHGGQTVETGAYHLEFVPVKETNGTHLDFYLQRGDNHEAIPNAKVTAQIQLPDGTQKTVPFTYDVKGKHYAGLLKEKINGQYQVKVNADIQGKKVDGRFNFNR
ncbi:hypothetical protein [Nostoc sp. UHCC 0251]|uniref:hypothetical protein n=1 Tax=Nostoc sp. UHCC 0251 TaxID=3110240 RepID=UPI002B1EF927|nr:hypothetical protein [Nostoc sp. UHCC 0251]MEA5623689.1 hypothetical protein [Nostoc sp. UHCC 0251]